MLKLSLSTNPHWIDLGMQVRVKVRPCNSAIFYQAKAFMQHHLQQIGEDYRIQKDSGADISHLPNVEDETVREALAAQYLTLGLALVGIIEWEGVLDNSDNNKNEDVIAPVNENNITQLFENYWVIAETFRQQYTGMRELLESEKNESRLACNGTATAGRSIAPTVPDNNSPARKDEPTKTEKNARTSKIH